MKNTNPNLKNTIKQYKEKLCSEFRHHGNITAITRKLAVFIDNILIDLFIQNDLDKKNHFCLLALGSYGRRELQLHSDIDLLLLHTEHVTKKELSQAQRFIRHCWDSGLNISHQITTIVSFSQLASHDLTVISSVLDMLLLCGNGLLQQELRYQIHPLHMWPSHEYFLAKVQEQLDRCAKYDETAYHLEPNVKSGPGGLRDLHMLLSISKRHFHISHLSESIRYGFMTEKEHEELMSCQHFLWRVRFALHLLAEKAEERLSFDYQIKLATFFNYQDKPHALAIEQFMKDYFKVTKKTKALNDMLLQWFNETFSDQIKQRIIPLDAEFQLANGFIETRNQTIFTKRPLSLLTLFHWIAKKPAIQGVKAQTIRLIRESLFLLSKALKESTEATTLFMKLLKDADDPYIPFKKMNEYGVLAHYLDCFNAITGQMQYDLFHAYTVDQHTLFVIRHISRFKQEDYSKQFTLCSQIISTLPQPEILYLSALFHDVAKGRGGDHSELGATEALKFAQRHHLSQEETELLTWLVQHHLIMSQTAQRQDIYDPNTIRKFCQRIPRSEYLDYLYLLTVADICATNPTLWNAWKDSLLKELYRSAKHRMQKEQELIDEQALITSKKQWASNWLIAEGFALKHIESLWEQFKERYFSHESSEMIAQQTKAILTTKEFPLVLIMPHHSQGGTEVFIYMPHQDERFTITTAVLSNHHATIQEASITTSENQYDLDTYVILDEKNQAFFDESRTLALQNALRFHLSKKQLPMISQKRIPRAMRHFTVKTEINYNEAPSAHTSLFLRTNDRPGLLAIISQVFLNAKIHLHNAKIATAGERVEDMFYLTNHQGTPLNQEEKESLKHQLLEGLERHLSS